MKIITNEKVIEQNLQPSAAREDPAGQHQGQAPNNDGEGIAGTACDFQDSDALGSGRVVNVWI